MAVLVRTTFSYKGYNRKHKNSHCEVQIFEYNNKSIVVLTELASNKGTSITNRAEIIATELLEQYKLGILDTIWIEHYPPTANFPGLDEHRYSKINFNWNSSGKASLPTWTHLESYEVAELIGEHAPVIS